VQHAVDILVEKTQDFFQIDAKIQSPTEWEEAVIALNRISTEDLPWAQVDCLLDCFITISNLFNAEHKQDTNSESDKIILVSDDLLPIFIFILIKSSLTQLASLSEYLWNLIDGTASSGQAGYYLTVFTSGVHYLKNFGAENPRNVDHSRVI